MQELTVRHYRPQDRPFVRRIAWETALLGESAQAFFDGEEPFSDFLTLYFTDYEPQSCFVAQSGSEVAGYLLGARNTAVLERAFRDKILFPLLFKAAAKGVFFKKKNLVFFFNLFKSLLRKEFRAPDFSREYPATLHINLQRPYRHSGAGSRLISAYLGYLAEKGVSGVHLATMSEAAAGFFQKQGFGLLYKGRRSYLRHILRRDIPLYIYGKKI